MKGGTIHLNSDINIKNNNIYKYDKSKLQISLIFKYDTDKNIFTNINNSQFNYNDIINYMINTNKRPITTIPPLTSQQEQKNTIITENKNSSC